VNVFDLLDKKNINSIRLFDFKDGIINDNLFIFYTEKGEKFILDFTQFFNEKAIISFLKEEKLSKNNENDSIKDFFNNVLYDKNLLPLIFNFINF
jgi:hypothetical protein